jgi:hypothetical protein
MYWDGETLVLDSTFTHDGDVVTNVVRYELADSGQTLVAKERLRGGHQSHDNTWVYEKRRD